MTTATDALKEAFRDWVIAGVPASGPNDPEKSAIRDAIDQLGLEIAGLGTGLLRYETKADLDADTNQPDGQLAYVWGDNTEENNTVYQSASGSWSAASWYFDQVATVVQPLVDQAQAAAEQAEAAAITWSPYWPELPTILSASASSPVMVETTEDTSHRAYFTNNWTNGTSYTVAAIVRIAGRRFFNIYCNANCIIDAVFDLQAGAIVSAGANNSATIEPLGRGFFLCTVTRVATATGGGSLQFRLGNGPTTWSYAGDGASGVCLASVSLKVTGGGVELLPSQLVTDAAFTKSGVSTSIQSLTDLTAIGSLETRTQAIQDHIAGKQAARLTEASGTSVSPSVYRTVSFTTGSTYRAEVEFAAGERHILNIYSNNYWIANASFDAASGSMTGAGASMEYLGGHFWRASVELAATATGNANLQLRVFPDSGGQPYPGDGSSGLYVVSVDFYKDGVLQRTDGAYDLASSQWSKQAVTVTVPTDTAFGGIDDRLSALENGGTPESAPLNGKKWAALGSSITAQGYYTSALASQSGMILTNLGYSGGSLGQATNGHYGSQKIYDQIASLPVDSEIVTLESGPNDFAAALVTLGALGDTTIATYYGALYAAAVAVLARSAAAKIVFITPYGADPNGAHPEYAANAVNANGNTLAQFQQAVVDVGNYLGVPVIDVGRKAGIGLLTAGALTSDGLHINALGGALHGSYDYRDLLAINAAGYFE